MAVATQQRWWAVIDGGRLHLHTTFDDAFVGAVRAIPSRTYHPETRHWSVGLANDRPRSLLRLVEHFALQVDAETDALLRSAADAVRDTFDLEVVRPLRDFPACVSLCDDWPDAELRLLGDQHECVTHPEVGRTSLILDTRSAHAARALWHRRDDVRWTRPLADEVERAARVSAARFDAGATPPRPMGGARLQVRFSRGRQELEITTSRCDPVLREIADAHRVAPNTVTASATRSAALGIARLIERFPDTNLSPSVVGWMPVALRWSGRITATTIDGTPRFVVAGDHDSPPPGLAESPANALDHGRWQLPLTTAGREALLALLREEPQTEVDPHALSCLQALEERPEADIPPALLTVEEHEGDDAAFALKVFWDDASVTELAGLPGSRARNTRVDPTVGVEVIADAWNATSVQEYADRHGLELDHAARRLLDDLLAESQDSERRVTMSRAREGHLHLPTLGGELMPFQAAGVEYALERRRTFIADEQGLGKTVEALATLEADDAFPAVVVCPASLKLNWQREARQWLPHRDVALIGGRATTALDGDILILNYEILDAHREAITALDVRALILDESHYCKNPKAKRTREAHMLSAALGPAALRLALTGTPLVNRAKELAPQLRILGRLEEFGSAASFERTFGDSAQRERLHWHLRRSCYLRRLKRDVLPQLPAKQRAVVPVTLANQAEYARAETAFLAWLHDHYRDADDLARRLDNAMRAEALVKINALRKLTGTGKTRVAADWIDDFLASGEKLVVFAEHRDVQAKLVERFPLAVHILGTDAHTDRDEAVHRFQEEDDVRLCVCSLKAAAHGLTLTAAANVAFIELGWTPAEHDQAEDRCHRIGQANAVTAWYLLAADTIDDRIAALIDHKRHVVGAITDGIAATDSAMVDALLATYLTSDPLGVAPEAAA